MSTSQDGRFNAILANARRTAPVGGTNNLFRNHIRRAFRVNNSKRLPRGKHLPL